MKAIDNLLLKVLVKQFYIFNAGFLLFIFFVFFGVVQGGMLISYHRSLILAIITSPALMAVVCTAWTLYNIKCILFCIAVIKNPAGNYIFSLRAVPPSYQALIYLAVAILQYLPVLAYSLFVVVMAFNRAMFYTAAFVTGFQLLMIIIAAFTLFFNINKNGMPLMVEKIVRPLVGWKGIKKGYKNFLPGNILHENKIAFLLVKIFSILLLSVSFVRNGDNFDEDLFSIFFQLIFAAHALLVFYCVSFMETKLQFSRNLPIGILNVAWMYLLSYIVLLLPEAAFMFVNNHHNLPITYIIILYLTAVAVLFLYTAILYACRLNMESYMLLIFAVFLMAFFLGKTGWQIATLIAVSITAAAIFKSSFYRFEKE